MWLRSLVHAAELFAVKNVDAVVVGGGVVGLALCAALGLSAHTKSLRVALLQPPLRPADQLARQYAVSPASIRLFDALDVWTPISADATPYDRMDVWDAMSPGAIRFSALETGGESLGSIIASSYQQNGMSRVQSLPSVEIVEQSLATARVTPSAVELRTDAGMTICARLAIGSDGPQSRLRTQLQMARATYEYGESGVVAALQTDRFEPTAFQRFLPSGPIALLPYRGGYSLVWTVPAQRAPSLLALPTDRFVDAVNTALTAPPADPAAASAGAALLAPVAALLPRAPEITVPRVLDVQGSRGSFPLVLSNARRYVQPRVALVGDAAHTIHPMAGQGLNLGLGDVAALVRALQRALLSGQDVGDLAALRPYETEAWRRNTAMQAGLHTLHAMFQRSPPWLAAVRGLGMLATHRLSPVKQALMAQALGASVDLRGVGSNMV